MSIGSVWVVAFGDAVAVAVEIGAVEVAGVVVAPADIGNDRLALTCRNCRKDHGRNLKNHSRKIEVFDSRGAVYAAYWRRG